MPWTRAQQITLAMVPKFSSLLSLAGSTWIVAEVLTGSSTTTTSRASSRHHHRLKSRMPNRQHPYHRLLLAMSIYDILESVWNFASTWPIPAGTANVYRPLGTTATCTAQGFFLTLSVAVPIYNACLALYYVLVVRVGISDRTLRRYVEPGMHAVAGLWGWGTAGAAAQLGLLNNANLWCWIAPYPADCLDSWRYGDDEGNCERGDNAWIYRWAFYFAPLWFCILFATVCTGIVCAQVKRLDRKTLVFRQPHRHSSYALQQQSMRASCFSASRSCDNGKSMSSLQDDDDHDDGVSTAVPRKHTTNNALPAATEEESIHDAANLLAPAEATRQHDDDNYFCKYNFVKKWWKRRQVFVRDNPRTVEVQQQAAMYLLVFVVTHAWSTSNRIVQQLDKSGDTYFGLLVLHSFFDPLQGFLNFGVYMRPRYLKLRNNKAKHHHSRWAALRQSLVLSCWRRQQSRDATTSSSKHSASSCRGDPSSDRNALPQRQLVFSPSLMTATMTTATTTTTTAKVLDTTTTSTGHHRHHNIMMQSIVEENNNDEDSGRLQNSSTPVTGKKEVESKNPRGDSSSSSSGQWEKELPTNGFDGDDNDVAQKEEEEIVAGSSRPVDPTADLSGQENLGTGVSCEVELRRGDVVTR